MIMTSLDRKGVALTLIYPERIADPTPLKHPPQNFLLSFVTHLGYNCARVALPIPIPSSARRMGPGRMGDDL